MDHFEDLGIDSRILRALDDEGYDEPTEVQKGAIPPALDGCDILGIAQTGTGKTAAFSIPILQSFAERPSSSRSRPIRALILTPTRELALQVHESFETYGRHLALRAIVILGGVGSRPQIDALRRGADILVATPGRLLDLKNQGHVKLDRVEVFVLDEADRMLDMGFIHDVRRVVDALPEDRQTLFFSATMPPEVSRLARQLVIDPVQVEVTPVASVASRIDQRVYFVDRHDKNALLVDLLANRDARRVLIFARTKHRSNRVAKYLVREGVKTEVIHSNKTQGARQRALAAFANGEVRVLVATDIMARGIDVDQITHVINYDVPDEPESYVHRIGRTARAGEAGFAFTFCDIDEGGKLAVIESLTDRRLHEEKDHAFRSEEIFLAHEDELKHLRQSGGRRRSGSKKKSRKKSSSGREARGRSRSRRRPSSGRPGGDSGPNRAAGSRAASTRPSARKSSKRSAKKTSSRRPSESGRSAESGRRPGTGRDSSRRDDSGRDSGGGNRRSGGGGGGSRRSGGGGGRRRKSGGGGNSAGSE